LSKMVTKPKSVLITGCSPGGIGNALALAFHSKGYRVFATARSLAKIEPLSSKGIEVLELDVTKPESITTVRADVKKRTGGTLDMLVNNAGTYLESPALDSEYPPSKPCTMSMFLVRWRWSDSLHRCYFLSKERSSTLEAFSPSCPTR